MISFDFLKLQVSPKEVVVDSTLRLLRGLSGFLVSALGARGLGSLEGPGALGQALNWLMKKYSPDPREDPEGRSPNLGP